MKAIHKYQKAARNGDREAQRRIAQSYGYKMSIHDMPNMVELMARAGIILPGYEVEQNIRDTAFVETTPSGFDNPHTVEVETIQL